MEKRGLSPVIATILLVALALVLALIIFLWARTFIGEAIEKAGSKIENSCEDVSFEVEAFYSDDNNNQNDKIFIENIGNVPIYGVEIREKRIIGGEIRDVRKLNEIINAGETTDVNLPSGLQSQDLIVVVPILLGENSGTGELAAHVCDDAYGEEVEIQ